MRSVLRTRPGCRPRAGFSFMEAVTALAILTVIITGVLVAVNHTVSGMVDNRARVMAFELARENMERLLGTDVVTDTTEFGVHELNEDIQWHTVVESFYEPVKSTMWIRAVCSASYTDSNGERQTVELVHWITDVSKAIEKQIQDQQRREQEFLEEMDGNPFGDDPDGLMQYANALAAMGDYERAAAVASQLILDYPDEPQAAAAWTRLLRYPELALAEGNPAVADGILDIIMSHHGQKPEATRVSTKLRPLIDSGQRYSPPGSGTGPQTGSTSPSGGSSAPGTGTPDAPGAGSGGGPSPGQGAPGQTGSGGDSHYPNPNWTPEQKAIWDMFMNRR